MENTIKCPFCYNEHKIDRYDWVETCKGYMHINEFQLIITESGDRLC